MKPRVALLAISLAANVMLAGLLFKPAPKVQSVASAHSVDVATKPQRQGPAAVQTNGSTLNAPQAPGFSWAQLESRDYKAYIATLRNFGVPERTVRDIIIADVEKMYRPKLAALRANQKRATNFWERTRPFSPGGGLTKEQREQLSALQKEQRDLIKDLLGQDVYREMAKDSGQPDWTERMYGSLPEEMREKVGQIQERLGQATQDIYAKSEGFIDQDTQAELKAVQRKFHDELAAILTPQQLEEYELRSSDVANQMRWNLSAFEPNEKEFRAIFEYRQALEDLQPQPSPAGDSQPVTPDEMKLRQQKQKELETALSDGLGPDRLKEFKTLERWEYQNLAQSGVSRETILQLADMQQQAQDAAARIRNDKQMSDEQRKEALRAVQAETEQSYTQLIGERRTKAYERSGGFWLRNLAPGR